MFEPKIEEFLSAFDKNTQRTYSAGLKAFQQFYKPNGTIEDFLDRLEEDMRRERNEKQRIARKTLNAFAKWLQEKGLSPKTVGVYVGAIQSLAQYFEIPISLRFVNLPAPQPLTKKHAWTIEEVSKFVASIENPLYKSIAASAFQSGLGLADLLNLTYGDIKYELKRGIKPLCLDLAREKTDVPFMTFLGEWAVGLLKEYLADRQLKDGDHIYDVTERSVDDYFARHARKVFGKYKGRNPYSPHTLRAAFRTILSDHKVDPLYIEFWMGHRLPEQQRVYISKSKEGWRQTYHEQAEPWLTPR